jgi:hypothetical protein
VVTESIACPLCQSKNHSLFLKDQNREYFLCSVCSFVFVPSQYHLSESEEKLRYDTHNNDPQDSRYRQFLSQLTLPLQELISDQSVGLDFGSGPGPTLSLMLEEEGYQVDLYDKYYAKDESVFVKEFDFITLTEVIEHLSDPIFELERLTSILKPGGCIAIMTQTMTKEIDFSKWYYKNDPSHIGFYNQESLIFLANYLGLESTFHSDRVIFFINN